MAKNVYECLLILDAGKASDVEAAKNTLHGLLHKHGYEILASRPWNGAKEGGRLAYPIGNHRKGQYYLIYFQGESTKMAELDADFRITEVIVRYLTLHIEDKLVEKMLEVARDENAIALHMAVDDSLEAAAAIDHDRPRRGRRERDPMEMKD